MGAAWWALFLAVTAAEMMGDVAFKRAGADGVLTYFAIAAAKALQSRRD